MDIDLKKEASDALAVFAGDDLVTIIKYPPDLFVIKSFNVVLLQLLLDKSFAKSLEMSQLNNQAILTTGSVKINNRNAQPTVANWLKDYYSQKQGDTRDVLALSDYLSKSVNYSKLDEREKGYVRTLLSIYRNVKHYPESMSNLPVDKWQIIPLELSASNEQHIEGVIASKSSDKKIAVKSVENTTPEQNKHLAELMLEANKYPVGSLERRAVEEEIKRVQS